MAILDASNSTAKRRAQIFHRCKLLGVKTFFIESICEDAEVVHRNVVQVKSTSPDYVDCSEEEAVQDFVERIRHYENQYQTIDVQEEQDLSFIKIINVGENFLIHKVTGYIQSRAILFLMNTKVAQRSIYLSRHGESMHNTEHRVGGDSPLSPRGRTYSRRLSEFVRSRDIADFQLWTSTLRRTIETGMPLNVARRQQWSALDEIDAGICDNMTYKEIEEQFPEQFELRKADKFSYRYPRGESYQDLVVRLEKVILELERQTCDVMCICHQAVIRCLLAYFMEISSEQLPYMDVPLHTVFILTPTPYGWKLDKICLDQPEISLDEPEICHHDSEICLDETKLDPTHTVENIDWTNQEDKDAKINGCLNQSISQQNRIAIH